MSDTWSRISSKFPSGADARGIPDLIRQIVDLSPEAAPVIEAAVNDAWMREALHQNVLNAFDSGRLGRRMRIIELLSQLGTRLQAAGVLYQPTSSEQPIPATRVGEADETVDDLDVVAETVTGEEAADQQGEDDERPASEPEPRSLLDRFRGN